jgi:hypothetical protein
MSLECPFDFRIGKQLIQIILHGGLGNQLFQWAFGHSIYDPNHDLEYIFISPRKDALTHAKTSLADLKIPCSHGEFVNKASFSLEGLSLKSLNVLNSRFNCRSGRSTMINTCDEPFNIPANSIFKDSKRKRIYFGYFHNKSIIEENFKSLATELYTAIQDQSHYTYESDMKGMDVIHIRGYKMENQGYKRNYGVLNYDFLKRVCRDTDQQRVLLTNDVQHAFEMSKGLKIDAILGPNDLNVFQCLALMAKAPRVYTANSTLSWWGGFLCLANGGEVFIPTPFYRDYKPNPGSAYEYEGFQTIQASFLP